MQADGTGLPDPALLLGLWVERALARPGHGPGPEPERRLWDLP